MLKRFVDVLASAVGLLLLSPLFAIVAIWVKVDSKGPVFFRQERVGRNERVFAMYKFRTMVAAADRIGPQVTSATDPRVTTAGRFLRRYKIDELPQLIDVLFGHMSLVGPRPEVPKYVQHYPSDLKSVVLSVRPGITDNASILFADEGMLLAKSSDPERTYIEDILPRKLRLYEQYVRNHSVWGDFKLILRTFVRIIGSQSDDPLASVEKRH